MYILCNRKPTGQTNSDAKQAKRKSFQMIRFGAKSEQRWPKYKGLKTADFKIVTWTAP